MGSNELEKLKENDKILDEEHRAVGICTISVGIESTKQWIEILNDPSHIFFKIPFVDYNANVYHDIDEMYNNRDLQSSNSTNVALDLGSLFNTGGMDIGAVVAKDVIGGSLGAVVGISNSKSPKSILNRVSNVVKIF